MVSKDYKPSFDKNNIHDIRTATRRLDASFISLPKKPYTYQIKAGKKVCNLILQSPTGSGKTEAALLWAQRNQKRNGRLFYTLPTTASLNAMYLRLKKSFNDKDNTLIGLFIVVLQAQSTQC
jgi:CRISPR/Cas system-associated endonuclease/helicase Cas3